MTEKAHISCITFKYEISIYRGQASDPAIFQFQSVFFSPGDKQHLQQFRLFFRRLLENTVNVLYTKLSYGARKKYERTTNQAIGPDSVKTCFQHYPMELSYEDVSTTIICTHVLNRGKRAVESPRQKKIINELSLILVTLFLLCCHISLLKILL